MAKKLVHDYEGCIGCGACAAIAPKYWEMQGAKAKLLKEKIDEGDLQDNEDAKDACPVNVIHIEDDKD